MRSLVRYLMPCLLWTPVAQGQIAPPDDIRSVELRRDAIVGATVVTRPGETLENATILMRDGFIEGIGDEIEVPAGYRVHDADGLFVYPGFVEASMVIPSGPMLERVRRGQGAHWNDRIVPQLTMETATEFEETRRAKLRKEGFTVAHMIPDSGILRGRGMVRLLAEDDGDVRVLVPGMQVAAFERGSWSSGYPSSQMGAIALLRETLAAAAWHREAGEIHRRNPDSIEPPDQADALEALAPVLAGDTALIFSVEDEHEAMRAASVAEEYDLDLVLLGSGTEFRRTDEIVGIGHPLVIPLTYPEKPELDSPYAADRITLRDLQSWRHGPSNVRRLLEAGGDVSVTTNGLDSTSKFHGELRKAIDAGLSPDEALACLTTRPARLLGIEGLVGTVAPGRLANLVVSDGPIFEKGAKIRDVWVAGRRDEITPVSAFPREGDFSIAMDGEIVEGVVIRIQRAPGKVTMEVPAAEETGPDDAEGGADPTGDDATPDTDEETTSDVETGSEDDAERTVEEPRATNLPLKKTKITPRRITFFCDGTAFDHDEDIMVTILRVDDRLIGGLETLSGRRTAIELLPVQHDLEPAEVESTADAESTEADDPDGTDGPETSDTVVQAEPLERLPVPLGAYGVLEPPRSRDVVVRNATIWTAADAGVLQSSDLHIVDGRIAAIGVDLERIPEDTMVIDGTGLHVTPGLIDCHSHTGISGGVNEGGQPNTAEVRIGDVVDPDDINWFRQLAGGLTAANQLHGSANPIGGQNSVVKLRWGGSARDMRIDGAPQGIKFALGENVKRGGGYPDTRMGVAAFIEDAFQAARERQEEIARYEALPASVRRTKLPPAPDFELDAVIEILEGDRLIHCHSYRQDEILMLLRLCERYGVRIGTLQHILEGYKVADAIAAHGAGASSFSDWWAYKMEVMDAIPENGALMHEVGVLVSFNSDDSEVATRMNDEAAKAVRWGGLDPHEALKFVTINPARQLGVDDRIGSLEVDKDADFVIWSAPPLSSFARCEQTWIDGARHYDRIDAAETHALAMAERGRLLGELSSSSAKSSSSATRGRRPGPRPTSLIARMLVDREAAYLERVGRGEDPTQIRAGECGCGSGSMIELARVLARERRSRAESNLHEEMDR